VPSPNVTNNHQEKNARVLETAGAVVMLEKDVTAEKMYAQVMELLGDESRRVDMTKALKNLVRTDSADAICAIVEELIEK
jgi:UDP-N-acetylglucosamine--N-acetylmuramyl-(pentapeptide) pyrophosphoryl-undecaprenol N-acetylglucosamine transferase